MLSILSAMPSQNKSVRHCCSGECCTNKFANEENVLSLYETKYITTSITVLCVTNGKIIYKFFMVYIGK